MEFNVSTPGISGDLSPTKSSAKTSGPLDGPSFGDWLQRSLETVNQMKNEADTAAENLITGENKDVHGTMIAMQKATIATNLMTEVRNKIIAAYDEIKRMQF